MDNKKDSIFAALWWQSAVSDKAHQITHSECHLSNFSLEIAVPRASPFAIYLLLSFLAFLQQFSRNNLLQHKMFISLHTAGMLDCQDSGASCTQHGELQFVAKDGGQSLFNS